MNASTMPLPDVESIFPELTAAGAHIQGVSIKDGSRGRGLFKSSSSEQPWLLIPPELLIDVKSLQMDGDQLVVRDAAKDDCTNNLLTRYINNHSLTDELRSQICEVVDGVSRLDPDLVLMLQQRSLAPAWWAYSKPIEERLFGFFCNSRQAWFGKKKVIVPVWEMMNHSPMAPLVRSHQRGFDSPRFWIQDEILVNYSWDGPFRKALEYGFFTEETFVHSWPFALKIQASSLSSLSCKGESVSPGLRQPLPKIAGSNAVIDGLILGSRQHGEILNQSFIDMMLKLGLEKSDGLEIFNIILQANLEERNCILRCMNSLTSSVYEKALKEALSYEIDIIETSINILA